MVIANDTPYSGLHTDPNRLKHAAATKLALTELFDGEPGNVRRFKSDFADRMKNVGLKAEFDVIVSENPRPDAISEADWQTDPNRFVVQNLLDTHAGITLAQVKAARDVVRRTVAALDRVPTARDPAAPHYASKQHRSWIAEFIKNSITSTVRSTLDAYEEDHDGDGVVLFFCFLQEFAGATREALVLAEEALHPMKLRLSNFNQDVKAFTSYCRLHLRNITGSGGQISHTHWIRIQEALEEAFTEKFRLQIMEWSKNWRKQSGEGHDWSMMQFLAKVDLEYTRLVNLNQWKTNDPNSTIVALRAEISDLKVALQATKPPPMSGQPKQKPTWVPKDGQPLEVFHNNKNWKYCGRCKRWNQTHTTLEHKSKATLPTQPASGGSVGGPSAHLAPGTQPAPSAGSSAATLSQPVASDSSLASGSYLNMDF
jgi:hypothetical protein